MDFPLLKNTKENKSRYGSDKTEFPFKVGTKPEGKSALKLKL